MTCTTSGTTRSCSSTITVHGAKEGPSMSNPPNDVSATLVLGSEYINDSACKMSPAPAAYTSYKYVPIVRIPSIYFYLTESLWLNLPPGRITSTTPNVVIRADFAPEVDVFVDVIKTTDNSIICTVRFEGNAVAGSSIDKNCNIPANYSGGLMLQRNALSVSTIKTEVDPNDPQYKAKLEGNINHTVCQTSVTATTVQPATHIVPSTQPMYDSPYGYTYSGSTKIQDTKNDAGTWNTGTTKYLRCYDNWQGVNDNNNKQDYYDIYKYNTETSIANNWQQVNRSLGSITAPLPFSTYAVPNNPPIIVDTSAVTLPYIYMVFNETAGQSANWGSLTWTMNDASNSGASASSTPKTWENITPEVCSGSASLTKIKLLRNRLSVDSNTSNIIMKAANQISSNGMSGGYYSYYFFCAYGRWHPSGKTSNNWVD